MVTPDPPPEASASHSYRQGRLRINGSVWLPRGRLAFCGAQDYGCLIELQQPKLLKNTAMWEE
jgi:hypothetical protein